MEYIGVKGSIGSLYEPVVGKSFDTEYACIFDAVALLLVSTFPSY